MRDHWGDEIKKVRNFNLFVWITSFFLVFSICGLTIYLNRAHLGAFFKDAKQKILSLFKEEQIETTIREVDLQASEFESLITRLTKLEEISYNYDSSNAELNMMRYLRSVKYNDAAWSLVGGAVSNDFIEEVKEKQGNFNLEALRYINTFTVPLTNEKVDFRHMFAVMNVAFSNNQEYTDLSSWGGDLIDLINNYKNSTLTGSALINSIKIAFNGTSASGFDREDVCADFDGINIIKLYKNNSFSLAQSVSYYYSSLTNENRINSFKTTTFTESYSSFNEFVAVVKNRLLTNSYIAYLARTKNLDLAAKSHIVDACVQVFAEYIY